MRLDSLNGCHCSKCEVGIKVFSRFRCTTTNTDAISYIANKNFFLINNIVITLVVASFFHFFSQLSN